MSDHPCSIDYGVREREGCENVDPSELIIIKHYLNELNMNFAWKIDHGKGVEAAELFTDDGCYVMPTETLRGKSQIRDWYQRRHQEQQKSGKNTIHLIQNLHIEVLNPNQATGTCYLTFYKFRNGLGFSRPFAICEYRDVYQRCSATDQWLFKHRDLSIRAIKPELFFFYKIYNALRKLRS